MPKLIDPNTGDTVYATNAGARVLRNRGWKDAAGAIPSGEVKAADDGKQEPNTPPAPKWPETHADLDAIAEKIDGFKWPDPPEGKKKLTVAEKVAALEKAGATPNGDE